MKYDNEYKNSMFESFYQFLKNDGLVAKKSERLHKKKIYANLLNNDAMTLENFYDFLLTIDKEIVNDEDPDTLIFESLSLLTQKELERVNINAVGFSEKAKKYIEKKSLSYVVRLSEENNKYLMIELNDM